jgi:glutamine amidotransferase-like uncharacterized protein
MEYNIAVYNGGTQSQSSKTALKLMFDWMNASTEIVYQGDIDSEYLESFDMIVIPGGWAPSYIEDLGTDGIRAIREFVEDGGAFFGVCAGAYFACDIIIWEGHTTQYPLDLVNSTGIGPIDEIALWPNYDMCVIELNHDSVSVDLSGEPLNHTVMYYGGPYFEFLDEEQIDVLATFSINDKPAMVTCEYGNGRVFLSGPHPEWEEDSQRDNCIWDNELEDYGSEWNMMLKVSRWLVWKNDTHTTTSDILEFNSELSIALGATSVAVIALVIFYLKRMR